MTGTRLPAVNSRPAGSAAGASVVVALSLGLVATTGIAAPTGRIDPAKSTQSAARAGHGSPAKARSQAGPRADDVAALQATTAALGDLGLALLRDAAGPNAVVSPVAVATVLGLVQSGATGTTEDEIEALFGAGAAGTRAMRQSLPALSAQLRADAGPAGQAAPLKQAARVWIDTKVARAVPASFQRRVAQRHGADAVVVAFDEPEAARAKINQWTAEHTAGRVAELLPAGSIGRSTQVTLTAAVHFRAAWARPFDAGQTEPRPFQASGGATAPVPTLNDERAVAQAVVDGTQLYALPFAGAYDLVLALPVAGTQGPEGGVAGLLRSASGDTLARWRAALQAATPQRCAFALPKFALAPKAGSIKASLERLGVKTAFTEKAELRPMLGRAAPGSHVDDVHHAAGIAVDEQGGEAVAAAAATVKPKTLAGPQPCAVDRAFAFAVMHRASGVPVFLGRVGDPALSE